MLLQSDAAPNVVPRDLVSNILLDAESRRKAAGEAGRPARPDPEAPGEIIKKVRME